MKIHFSPHFLGNGFADAGRILHQEPQHFTWQPRQKHRREVNMQVCSIYSIFHQE